MIKLNQISKKYNNLQILKNFSIEFKENNISCLFGPSGVGKTTIANIVANLVLVDEGSITNIEKNSYSYVFQEPRLLNWYNVYNNIDFVLKDIYSIEKRKHVVNDYLDMVGLTDYKDYMINELSGGMAQRVSLARAFAYPSNVLIMDEPFKGLDIKLKTEMIKSFQRLWNKDKRTVIFITHDVDEAIILSNTIFIIKDRPAKVFKSIDVLSYSNSDEIKKILLKS